MKISQLILLSILLIAIHSALPSCKKAKYDHYQFVLTWPNEYCSEHKCVTSWKDMWDGKSMVIHGFWPGSSDLSYLSCLIEHKVDPYCNHPYSFSYSKFSTSQKKELKKYWPQIGQIKNFWAYEWNKHGTCYLKLIKDDLNSSLSTTNIFKEYFMETIAKAKDLDIELTPGKINSKSQLADILALYQSEFYAICGRDDELDQIRVCYDIYKVPGEEYLIDCPHSTDRSQCKFPMYIK